MGPAETGFDVNSGQTVRTLICARWTWRSKTLADHNLTVSKNRPRAFARQPFLRPPHAQIPTHGKVKTVTVQAEN